MHSELIQIFSVIKFESSNVSVQGKSKKAKSYGVKTKEEAKQMVNFEVYKVNFSSCSICWSIIFDKI
jgi:hypothetical protein